jgi:8-oxo-dGTP pyrophosphatase MutT (NUDIX family)
MAAGVLLTDAAERVLIVEPVYKDYWEIPGGTVDANESPYAAACRELVEELGLSRAEVAGLVLPADELRGYVLCTVEEAAVRLSPVLAREVAQGRRERPLAVDGDVGGTSGSASTRSTAPAQARSSAAHAVRRPSGSLACFSSRPGTVG